MMHLTDEQVVRLIAGELSATQVDDARSHIDACPECAARVREHERLWSLLGAWGTAEPAPDVTADVLSRLDRETQARVRPAILRLSWTQVGRIAAGVLIGVGVGHGIGRRVAFRPTTHAPSQAAVTAADVVEAMALDVFASAPTGLSDVMAPGLELGNEQEDRS